MKFHVSILFLLLFFSCNLLFFASCSKDSDLFDFASVEQIDESEEVLDAQNKEESDGEEDSETQSGEESVGDADSQNGEEGSEEIFDMSDDTNFESAGSNQKYNIIFDTDANNELDDQHALAYLLSNGDYFNLEALTVNATPTGGGIQNDVDEATRILQLYNLQNDITVHAGAQGTFSTISSNFNPNSFDGIAAVDAMITSTNNTNCIIVAVGKLTNVALAILKDPTIVNRTKVVWLGTNYPNNREYNLESDIDAMNYVLNSTMPLEIVTVRLGTAENGSSSVSTTVTEVNNRMPGLGPLATSPITGRHGGTFNRFGDYSVNLFDNIGKELRSLFDLVALSIIKEPAWGLSNSIPAPIYQNGDWVDRPANTRTILVWGDFDVTSIREDFFESLENYFLVQ